MRFKTGENVKFVRMLNNIYSSHVQVGMTGVYIEPVTSELYRSYGYAHRAIFAVMIDGKATLWIESFLKGELELVEE